LLILGLLTSAVAAAQDDEDPSRPTVPSYKIRLSLSEFSVLHGAAVTGVDTYGGDADFQLKLIKDGQDVFSEVTIQNPRLLEVWGLWMAEWTSRLVSTIDAHRLDSTGQMALDLAKAVTLKLQEVKKSPIYAPVTVPGTLAEAEGKLCLETDHGRYILNDVDHTRFGGVLAHPVTVTGYHKVAGQLEVVRLIERKPNTVQMFVMSQCPFGKMAERSILNYLKSGHGPVRRPRLEVHYIFYSQPPEAGRKEGPSTFTSLHGEKEIEEDLVQMLIRDEYDPFFEEYLAQRASSEAPWSELAQSVGLSSSEIEYIRERSHTDRQALIEKEYKYATEQYQILDGSPTFVWDDRRVLDVRTIKYFADFQFSSPTCSESN
jgi:hypothetical protein